MTTVTINEISPTVVMGRTANCQACLTRQCAMVGSLNSPVSDCASYRQANCYLCAQSHCPLMGQLESPVLACDQFQLLVVLPA